MVDVGEARAGEGVPEGAGAGTVTERPSRRRAECTGKDDRCRVIGTGPRGLGPQFAAA
jgi:hypothetical protein